MKKTSPSISKKRQRLRNRIIEIESKIIETKSKYHVDSKEYIENMSQYKEALSKLNAALEYSSRNEGIQSEGRNTEFFNHRFATGVY